MKLQIIKINFTPLLKLFQAKNRYKLFQLYYSLKSKLK